MKHIMNHEELQEMLTFFSNSCNSFFAFSSFSLSFVTSVSLSFSLACSSFLLFLEIKKKLTINIEIKVPLRSSCRYPFVPCSLFQSWLKNGVKDIKLSKIPHGLKL